MLAMTYVLEQSAVAAALSRALVVSCSKGGTVTVVWGLQEVLLVAIVQLCIW